eukprot:TRINITY_DN634_c0_g1_i1.p1 TRINITY_DN634_c0_g1~~TRINITY_DN634_c0_g1_i1.p1  ORF type:complete len:380 (+),score=98.74 TRINITY_DN634_c0_g1_i1:99-1142(+)
MNNQPHPERIWAPRDQWIDLLGFKIASPIGVPAGPLLNAKWVETAANLGFDVVTYKTIRSKAHAGHPHPNMVYVSIPEDKPLAASQYISSIANAPQSMGQLAVTNSFGMPSQSPEFLRQDIPLAKSKLKDGQVMIVSVVGTPSQSCGNPSQDYTEFVRDFVEVATFAKDCGASIIEANFSCPNVASKEGSIYQSVESTKDIATALTNALGDTPLILKVGTYEDKEMMRKVFRAASEAKVSAMCGINSLSMKVLSHETNEPVLGPNRLTSGVCGGPIRNLALDFISNASSIIKEDQLNLTLLGCGGITEDVHFKQFLDAGAKVALTATGMLWDPYLAARYHSMVNKQR